MTSEVGDALERCIGGAARQTVSGTDLSEAITERFLRTAGVTKLGM